MHCLRTSADCGQALWTLDGSLMRRKGLIELGKRIP